MDIRFAAAAGIVGIQFAAAAEIQSVVAAEIRFAGVAESPFAEVVAVVGIQAHQGIPSAAIAEIPGVADREIQSAEARRRLENLVAVAAAGD